MTCSRQFDSSRGTTSCVQIDARDTDHGEVKFQTDGARLVRVTVEFAYVRRTTVTAAEEIAYAEGTLRRDLEKYRLLVLDRCKRESCRPS